MVTSSHAGARRRRRTALHKASSKPARGFFEEGSALSPPRGCRSPGMGAVGRNILTRGLGSIPQASLARVGDAKYKPAYFKRNIRVFRVKMVGPRRFELLTFCTPSRRATSLRYGPIFNKARGSYQLPFSPSRNESRKASHFPGASSFSSSMTASFRSLSTKRVNA